MIWILKFRRVSSKAYSFKVNCQWIQNYRDCIFFRYMMLSSKILYLCNWAYFSEMSLTHSALCECIIKSRQKLYVLSDSLIGDHLKWFVGPDEVVALFGLWPLKNTIVLHCLSNRVWNCYYVHCKFESEFGHLYVNKSDFLPLWYILLIHDFFTNFRFKNGYW